MRNFKVRLVFYGVVASLLLLIFVIAAAKPANATSSHVMAGNQQNKQNECHTKVPAGQWSPVGGTWTLTVSFLTGSRHGQQESQVMTFLPSGGLTSTFPGTFMPPVVDGGWCMVLQNVFEYHFEDPIIQNGQQVAYVAVHQYATLTSSSTYESGGVGVAYVSATGQPIPGEYGMTHTSATRS